MRTVQASSAGVLTIGTEMLILVDEPARVGRAVCLSSGGRLAFRRVLGVDGSRLRLRADVAPFEDAWDGDIVGCVKPRLIDRVAAIDPERFTRANWSAAMKVAEVLAARRRAVKKRAVACVTRVLAMDEWSRVRAFWRQACGKELQVVADPRQHVIGLFDGDELVGANIHLFMGTMSYSAFTLVDRRYRGTGGGQKMIAHAVRFARAHGLDGIYVHINSRNLPSIRAYERAGFQQQGWWRDAADPLASAERQWLVLEADLR